MTRICDALGVPRGVTAVVGAGGKTSLIDRLCRELAGGAKVLRMTTTHIYPPDCPTLYGDDVAALKRLRGEADVVCVGTKCPDGKLTAPGFAVPDLLALFDYVLVEADGAHGRPLKAPEAHEPALPEASALVVVVAGLSGLDGAIERVAHRPARYAELLGKQIGDRVTARDVARVLGHPDGGRKGVRCAFAVLLNQADDAPRQRAGQEIAQMLCARTVVTALRNEEMQPD